MTARACLIACALICAARPALAQDIRFMPGPSAECVQDRDDPKDCVGASAYACMEATPDGSTTLGMAECLARELALWDEALTGHYGRLMESLTAIDAENAAAGLDVPSQADAARAMQTAWIAYRDARCAFVRSRWGNGTGGGPAQLDCLMGETARKSLLLEGALQWP